MTVLYFNIRNSCPACNGLEFEKLAELSYQGDLLRDYMNLYSGEVEFSFLISASYILDRCKECKLIYQRQVPNDYLMERIYEHWINPSDSYDLTTQYDVNYYTSNARHIEKAIAYLKKLPKNIKVLDFGLGWGLWARMAQGYGLQVYGTELSVSRIAHAKKNGVKIIPYDNIPNYQFDLINTTQVFEHIPDPFETLAHLVSGLQANGLIRINIPYDRNISSKLIKEEWKILKWHLKGMNSAGSLNSVAPLEHINCFSTESLLHITKRVGLEPFIFIQGRSEAKSLLDISSRDLLRPPYRLMRKLLGINKKQYTEYYIKKK